MPRTMARKNQKYKINPIYILRNGGKDIPRLPYMLPGVDSLGVYNQKGEIK